MRHNHNHYFTPEIEEMLRKRFYHELGYVRDVPLNDFALKWCMRIDFNIQSGLGSGRFVEEDDPPPGGCKIESYVEIMTRDGGSWTKDDGTIVYTVDYEKRVIVARNDVRYDENRLDQMHHFVGDYLAVDVSKMGEDMREWFIEEAIKRMSTLTDK